MDSWIDGSCVAWCRRSSSSLPRPQGFRHRPERIGKHQRLLKHRETLEKYQSAFACIDSTCSYTVLSLIVMYCHYVQSQNVKHVKHVNKWWLLGDQILKTWGCVAKASVSIPFECSKWQPLFLNTGSAQLLNQHATDSWRTCIYLNLSNPFQTFPNKLLSLNNITCLLSYHILVEFQQMF